jgi:transcriptional regulator with XRE-family HTH domain
MHWEPPVSGSEPRPEEERLRKDVASSLQRMRSTANLTQKQVATLAGMSQSEVSRLERAGGTLTPSISTVVRFASVCGYELKLVATRDALRSYETSLETPLNRKPR